MRLAPLAYALVIALCGAVFGGAVVTMNMRMVTLEAHQGATEKFVTDKVDGIVKDLNEKILPNVQKELEQLKVAHATAPKKGG